MRTLLDFVKQYVSKKDFYRIPRWDKIRMGKMEVNPDFETGVEHIYAYNTDKKHYVLTDKRHYILSQLIIEDGCYTRYELMFVTSHGLSSEGYYKYKTYKPLVRIWL